MACNGKERDHLHLNDNNKKSPLLNYNIGLLYSKITFMLSLLLYCNLKVLKDSKNILKDSNHIDIDLIFTSRNSLFPTLSVLINATIVPNTKFIIQYDLFHVISCFFSFL
jgi:hypothetical protein